eukprot:6211592-Amphidinium_carterae.1
MVTWSHMRLLYDRTVRVESNLVADFQVARKSDLCGLDVNWKLRGCADATLEQLSQLIYLKLVHESLTFLARRLLENSWKGSGVSAQQ